MQAVARDEFGRRRDRMRRQIARKVERAHREVDGREEGDAARVGVGLREIHEPHVRRAQQLGHGRRLGGVAGQEHGVGLAGFERVGGLIAGERQQIGVAGSIPFAFSS